jgi:hypothetical protein
MSQKLDEALLEMHFFSSVVAHFSSAYGAHFLKLIKPSRQNEAFVGFDQGWVCSTKSADEVFSDLKSSVQSSGASTINHFYLGFFLQYKVVHQITKVGKYKPNNYVTPYFRCELDLKPNKTTKISQHETLRRLTNVKDAVVSYACPMLFSIDAIYETVNLSDLRCVPVNSAPNGWHSDERHFLTFTNVGDAEPMWCSEPVKGKSFSFSEWASPNSDVGPRPKSAEEILSLIEAAREAEQLNKTRRTVPHESLTILEFER